MRRAISVLLFVIAGWILAPVSMLSWISVGQDHSFGFAMSIFFWALSAPFLLLGMWASPGVRLVELGLTLMIAAAVGAALGLSMVLFLSDPTFLRLLPPGQTLSQFKFEPLVGLPNLTIMGAAGWLLYRRRRKEAGGP